MRISHISLFLRSLCSRYLDYINIQRVALVETLGFELQRDHVKPMLLRQPSIGPVQQVRGLGGCPMAALPTC